MLKKLPEFNAAFLDPDWADTGPGHIYKFIDSNTKPPADKLFDAIYKLTNNIALILPPQINVNEFEKITPYELQRIYLGEDQVLFCLYFGDLAIRIGETELRIDL